MMTHSDYTFMMKYLPVLEALPLDPRLLWVRRMIAVHYAKGVKLQCGSNNGVGLILLKTGSLRIYLLSREGREISLYHLHRGEACVLSTGLAADTVAFDAHIEAGSDCEALLISTDSFAAFCNEHAFIQQHFGKLLTQQISLSVLALERALSMSLNQRVAVFLIEGIAEIDGNDIELTHDQIARHIGSTREVVTRTLNHFSDWGVVKLTRGNVEVLDQDKLDGLTQ